MNDDSFNNFLNLNSDFKINKSTILEAAKIPIRKLGYAGTSSIFTNKIFNSDIKISSNPKILFSTRLWDPYNNPKNLPGNLVQERKTINKERITLIKKLKEEFGEQFIGGIEYSKFAKKRCPELILPFRTSIRKNYIELMKSADICIATPGLHKSIGWKFWEYVAASKCIVSNPLFYETYGKFEINKNYFVYNNYDELFQLLNYLIENPETVYATKINNKLYFEKYLRPDRLVYNSIKNFL